MEGTVGGTENRGCAITHRWYSRRKNAEVNPIMQSRFQMHSVFSLHILISNAENKWGLKGRFHVKKSSTCGQIVHYAFSKLWSRVGPNPDYCWAFLAVGLHGNTKKSSQTPNVWYLSVSFTFLRATRILSRLKGGLDRHRSRDGKTVGLSIIYMRTSGWPVTPNAKILVVPLYRFFTILLHFSSQLLFFILFTPSHIFLSFTLKLKILCKPPSPM